MSFKAPHLICDHCGVHFTTKRLLENHLRIHFVCVLCKLDFKNKGLLACHTAHKHPELNNKRKNTKKYKHECPACKVRFKQNSLLKYHIRKAHYNLLHTTPYCDYKGINEFWYEKVLNTNFVVEIKKIDHNILLIRRLCEGTMVKVTEMDREEVDLHMMYPTDSCMKTIQCNICLKMCLRKEINKHIIEQHGRSLKRRCNECNCVFKRLTMCLNHVCPKKD